MLQVSLIGATLLLGAVNAAPWVSAAPAWNPPTFSEAVAAHQRAAADNLKKSDADKSAAANKATVPAVDGKSNVKAAVDEPIHKAIDPKEEAKVTEQIRAAKSPEPKGIAFFPALATAPGRNTTPYGFIEFVYTSETSARIEVRLTNMPEDRGPFSYHIHTDRVSEHITDPPEQCKAAKGHLDPANVGEAFVCDSEKKGGCQAGDLTGKYGKIPASIKSSQVYKEVYDEKYISWKASDANFFVNRSIVIHEASNKGRIACANILAL
ncbi:protein of unknown function [Taphrina deformans PYCC 5710]|uniref:Superoxide dismutase copper/zinc binding domain-containing protein n=1 Tax=Taphrina deformans (strain PYCC 5710 / ATCC 11124 / CBS 356.35 / IMI 108563 / JCM 9778 / NBRC 8474) TaxID=1097556 RepID=R4XE07_TAPDE|nr:protein of unknown function [Taphrina deformans PYCC 5710]|eukprot:CCG84096.1 protein of unknown function [Taphrina deformans PYCC 5710]